MSIIKDILDNPIVEEIRVNWEVYAEQFDHDLYRIYEDLKAKEENWKSQGFEFIETIEQFNQELEKKPESEN